MVSPGFGMPLSIWNVGMDGMENKKYWTYLTAENKLHISIALFNIHVDKYK